jgi:hypothetical protein
MVGGGRPDGGRDALAALDRDVMGRLPDVGRMSEDAYREGQADILDLLDALRARTSAQITRLDAIEAVVQSEGEVLALVGGIEELPPENAAPAEPASSYLAGSFPMRSSRARPGPAAAKESR